MLRVSLTVGCFSLRGLNLPEYRMHRTKSEEDIFKCGLKGSSKLWIGKDYVNFIYKDFVNLESPFAGMNVIFIFNLIHLDYSIFFF